MPQPELVRVNYVSELTEKEKDKLLELIVDRLGCDLWSYKFDGESARVISIMVRDQS